MPKVIVAAAAEIPPGQRRTVEHGGVSIGVFNIDGTYRAVRNSCPHHGAPVCQGRLTGTALPSAPHTFVFGRQGRILSCPWHHWEFDLESSRCLTDERYSLRTYPVAVEDGQVVVDLG